MIHVFNDIIFMQSCFVQSHAHDKKEEEKIVGMMY